MESCDIEIIGKVPSMVVENLTKAQAKLNGLKGWVEKTGDKVKVHFEGEKKNMKKTVEVIKKSDFVTNFSGHMKTQFKEIKQLTSDVFEVRSKNKKSKD